MNNKELNNISKEIRSILEDKQKEMSLSFVEDTHTYFIKNKEGKIVSNLPSVSTVIKQFYEPFDRLGISNSMSNGDLLEQHRLLTEWDETANYANSIGSRTHYILEKDLLQLYGSYKEVRKPIFNCNKEQLTISNNMIDGGHDFIRLMHRRKCVLLDTEMILGSLDLGYVGQPDKMWLSLDKQGELGLICSDWKSNKEKNFKIHQYTKPMLSPFQNYMDTALTHYMIQLPLYVRLLLDMLKGTKYENIKYLGSIIVHLNEHKKFNEYRISKDFSNIVMTMKPLIRINKVLEHKRMEERLEEERLEKIKFILND